MADFGMIDGFEDRFEGLLFTFGFPRGVPGVAEPAAEVAAAGANKEAWGACEHPFTLNAFENFCDPNQILGSEWWFELGRVFRTGKRCYGRSLRAIVFFQAC